MLNTNDIDRLTKLLPFWDKLSEYEREYLLAGTKPVCYKQDENVHSPSNECGGVIITNRSALLKLVQDKRK